MKRTAPDQDEKRFFYNRLARAIIPAGKQTETGEVIYEEEEWSSLKIKLTETDLIYEGHQKSGSIEIKNIYYMDRKLPHPKADSPRVLSFNYQTEEGDFIALIKNRTTRSKEILKKRLLRQIVKNSNIWYKERADQDSDREWNDGVFKIGDDNTLRIESTKGEVVTTIPPENVIRLNPITKLKKVNLKIFRLNDEGEVQVDLIYSTEIPLDIVTDFFYIDYLEEHESKLKKDDLSLQEKKILMVLEEKEAQKKEEKTIHEDELISQLSWSEEETQKILSSLTSKKLIVRMDNKILRTFAGVDSTPEKLDLEKHKKEKELERKKEEREERLEKLLKLKEQV